MPQQCYTLQLNFPEKTNSGKTTNKNKLCHTKLTAINLTIVVAVQAAFQVRRLARVLQGRIEALPVPQCRAFSGVESEFWIL